MIPLKDNVPSTRVPYVTYSLIAANVLAFLLELQLSPARLKGLVMTLGFVPDVFFTRLAEGYYLAAIIPIFTSMFLHAGFLHLAGNMLFLYIFGDNVEDRLGHGRYLVFYLLGGATGALAQGYAAAGASIPMIGASAAIAAVLGGYFLLFPRARVLTLFPVLFFFPIIPLRAVWFLGIWIVVQVINGSMAIGLPAAQGGVAWLAHASGFLVGAGLVWAFRGRRRASIDVGF